MSQSLDSVNPRLKTLAVEPTPNLSSIQSRPYLMNPTSQSIIVAQASSGQSVDTFLVLFILFILVPGGVIGFVIIARQGIVVIGDSEVGIVIKKFNLNPFHPKLPVDQLIGLNGEAGPQAKILAPGLHWGYFPQLYIIRKEKFIEIHPNEIGLVVAKDGANIPPEQLGQLFGKPVECNNFQDACAFLTNGGQKGKQLDILKPGTYRINTELFEVKKKPAINISSDTIGLLVAKDGTSMPPGRQLGKVVECNNFQDAHAFIANGGQKGKQLEILTAGTYQINTDLFSIYTEPVINIPQGEIGLVVAKDGASMPPEQQLGKTVECNNFQEAHTFIANGGQKGKQLAILTAGIYQINIDLFTVITSANAKQYDMKPEDLQVYKIEAGKIGIVTTYDGLPLQKDEIAGVSVAGHDNFQNGQKFIDGGGRRGLQEEILPPGSWNLNPWFVKVEQVELTDVPVGTVGVVISHVGKSCENKDGVVERGCKGVWHTPLYPGKHVINTKVMNVEIVPTLPITLDWSNKEKLPTNYDANLHPLELRSKDAFTFDIEVTQVIRIAEEKAPTMIYRVGNTISGSSTNSIKALIVKVLEPAISAYFRNSAQNSKALDFLDKRSYLERQAKEYIKSALRENAVEGAVEALETLIGKIELPDDLEKIVTDRERAIQEAETLKAQRKTEEERQKLEREKALTNIQINVVKAEQDVKISELIAIANKYRIDLEIEQARRLREIEVEILRTTIDIIGHEGWQDIEKLKELVKLKLPEVWVNNSHDGGSGLIDVVMPQVLRTLRNSTNGSNKTLETSSDSSNGLSAANQTHKTLEASSTVFPPDYVTCTNCDSVNQLNNHFCSSCGQPLTDS
ncbi:SPFH domain-containing protein [Nostoc sp. FACHB-190]|uniref:SPFH domain-containing protein n=1 Tax=Nostoc sp. FACHB-190 TaxID=2692838 RepID=UPI0016840289|nr:SPFH domain-containing protein [Nostoc sp. FACHB-190]MBD2297235.1 hypothetical protein [Nostoc sp. FACHB-190]